jgi:hypothetical protein
VTIWERRDLPVLRALATSEDENLRQGFLHLDATEQQPLGLELPAKDVRDALLTLLHAGYIEGELQREGPDSVFVTHFQVTGRGYQALGEWPLFDQLASPATLALLLERLAEEASSPQEQGSVRRAASYAGRLAGSTLKAAAIGAGAHVARVGLGLG